MRGSRIEQDRERLLPFQMRGHAVQRIEGFSDCVFGFALTLLVVSLEVPRSFPQLMTAMRGLPAFAFCFYLFFLIWMRQNDFFRRYGLNDTLTLILNGVLLFVVLFYVYPLKFLFTLFINGLLGIRGVDMQVEGKDIPTLFLIYGLGFAAVFGVFALLHANAYRQRTALELNAYERDFTRLLVWRDTLIAGVGLLSAGIALLVPPKLAGLSGFVYFAMGIVEGIVGTRMGDLNRCYQETEKAGAAGKED